MSVVCRFSPALLRAEGRTGRANGSSITVSICLVVRRTAAPLTPIAAAAMPLFTTGPDDLLALTVGEYRVHSRRSLAVMARMGALIIHRGEVEFEIPALHALFSLTTTGKYSPRSNGDPILAYSGSYDSGVRLTAASVDPSFEVVSISGVATYKYAPGSREVLCCVD